MAPLALLQLLLANLWGSAGEVPVATHALGLARTNPGSHTQQYSPPAQIHKRNALYIGIVTRWVTRCITIVMCRSHMVSAKPRVAMRFRSPIFRTSRVTIFESQQLSHHRGVHLSVPERWVKTVAVHLEQLILFSLCICFPSARYLE